MRYIFNLPDETFSTNRPLPTPTFITQPLEEIWFVCVQCDELLFRKEHLIRRIGENCEYMIVNEAAVQSYNTINEWGLHTYRYRCPDCRTRLNSSPLYALPFTNKCSYSTPTERRTIEFEQLEQINTFRDRYVVIKSSTVEQYLISDD